MRPVHLGNPPADTEGKIDWIIRALKEIEQASHDESDQFFDAFTVTNVTTTRTFDADATTVAELADVVGTFLTDFKERVF